MTTQEDKRKRIAAHVEALGDIHGKTWGNIWEAQADYLDQHFVERGFYEQLREALEWALSNLAITSHVFYAFATGHWTCAICNGHAWERGNVEHKEDCSYGKAEAALEAAKEE